MFRKRIYLDAAAGVAGNASSPHQEGRQAHERIEGARSAIARLVEAKADDVVFTSGATEANALAILGTFRAATPESPGPKPHLLYLPSAHASITENMKQAEREGAVIEPLPIRDYRVDVEALRAILRPETILISMDAVCGETGVIWNTREVRAALDEFASQLPAAHVEPSTAHTDERPRRSFMGKALLHVDASQAPLTEKLTRSHFGADLLVLDGAKVSSVRGAGALVAHRTVPLEPLYQGGGQERGLRPGSEAPELAEAFAEGLATAAARREQFSTEAARGRSRLTAQLMAALPRLLVNEGDLAAGRQAPHILNLSLPGTDTDYLVALLDEAGFAISTRSACETDSQEGSRAVFALTGDAERAMSTLRISWDARVRARDLKRFADALIHAVAFVEGRG